MLDLKNMTVMTPAEAGADVELEHPVSGEPLVNEDGSPWKISVRGEDSQAVRAVVKKQHDRRIEKMRKNKSGGFDSDTVEAEQTERLVAATIGWSGLVMDGKPYDFSIPNARKLYGNPEYIWIVEQVEKAMGDRQRFFTNASKS